MYANLFFNSPKDDLLCYKYIKRGYEKAFAFSYPLDLIIILHKILRYKSRITIQCSSSKDVTSNYSPYLLGTFFGANITSVKNFTRANVPI